MTMIRSNKAQAKFPAPAPSKVGILDSGIDRTQIDFSRNGRPAALERRLRRRARLRARVPISARRAEPVPRQRRATARTSQDRRRAAQRHRRRGRCAWRDARPGLGVRRRGLLVERRDRRHHVRGRREAERDQHELLRRRRDDDHGAALRLRPERRATVAAVDRAIAYARSRGVTPVAALGNNAENMAGPGFENCRVVPAESPGVIGVSAIGPTSSLADYSNYGSGPTTSRRPVATRHRRPVRRERRRSLLSTMPGQQWAYLNGTSMASPHAAGVAALIESRYGKLGRRPGDMKPDQVEPKLKATAMDIGAKGYDQYSGTAGSTRSARSAASDKASPPLPPSRNRAGQRPGLVLFLRGGAHYGEPLETRGRPQRLRVVVVVERRRRVGQRDPRQLRSRVDVRVGRDARRVVQRAAADEAHLRGVRSC